MEPAVEGHWQKGELRESEDARLEGSQALAFGACSLSNRTWRGSVCSGSDTVE